jgi:hypothetical protein
MAKREEREPSFLASADRAIRRAVRRLVKIERRLERARRELDDAAADLENLHGRLRALRVAMVAGAAESAEVAGEKPSEPGEPGAPEEPAEEPEEPERPGEPQEPAEEPPEPAGEVEGGPEAVDASTDLQAGGPAGSGIEADEPTTDDVARLAPQTAMAPELAGSAESQAEAEARIEVANVFAAELTSVAESPTIDEWVPSPAPVAELPAVAGEPTPLARSFEFAPVPEAPPAAGSATESEPVAVPDVAIPDAGPTPWAGEAAVERSGTAFESAGFSTAEPPAGPSAEPPAGPSAEPPAEGAPPRAPEDVQWPLPEATTSTDEGSTLPGAPGGPVTDADAPVSEVAEEGTPQRRVFRGWPFIDPERRW